MNVLKTYFLPPTADFLPPYPAGPIKLGSIITSTKSPDRPLNAGFVIDPPTQEVHRFTETDWKKTISSTTGYGFGVYAQFLQMIGFGPEVKLDHNNTSESILSFASLTTESFNPSPEYVKSSVAANGVQHFLRTNQNWIGRSPPVYLVTGLKTVRGAQVQYSVSNSTEFSTNMTIDLTLAGVPVTFGPRGNWKRINSDDSTTNRADTFVFAFRVRQLTKKRGKLSDVDFNEGAFLGVDEDGDDQEEQDIMIDDEVNGVQVPQAVCESDPVDSEDVYCVWQ